MSIWNSPSEDLMWHQTTITLTSRGWSGEGNSDIPEMLNWSRLYLAFLLFVCVCVMIRSRIPGYPRINQWASSKLVWRAIIHHLKSRIFFICYKMPYSVLVSWKRGFLFRNVNVISVRMGGVQTGTWDLQTCCAFVWQFKEKQQEQNFKCIKFICKWQCFAC